MPTGVRNGIVDLPAKIADLVRFEARKVDRRVSGVPGALFGDPYVITNLEEPRDVSPTQPIDRLVRHVRSPDRRHTVDTPPAAHITRRRIAPVEETEVVVNASTLVDPLISRRDAARRDVGSIGIAGAR